MREESVKKRRKMEIGEKVSKDDFFIGNLLGQGAYGRVFKVKRLKTNQICAMKIVDIGSSQDKTKTSENDVQNEIVINILLGEHPKISRFYGSFGDQKKTYLVFECLKSLLCMDFTIEDSNRSFETPLFELETSPTGEVFEVLSSEVSRQSQKPHLTNEV